MQQTRDGQAQDDREGDEDVFVLGHEGNMPASIEEFKCRYAFSGCLVGCSSFALCQSELRDDRFDLHSFLAGHHAVRIGDGVQRFEEVP